MNRFVIQGREKIRGKVKILGAKNGILPLMAGAILAQEGETIIYNVPDIKDIRVFSDILSRLGASVKYHPRNRKLRINCENMTKHNPSTDLVQRMRGSVLLLGPVLSRFGKIKTTFPGGCKIGNRRINIHLDGLRELGANILQEKEIIQLESKSLIGTKYYLDFPSHTGTENIMLAACLAKGTTTLINAACEPEIIDLALFLNSMGAKIKGAGSPFIKIKGVKKLSATKHVAIPSRIETEFFIAATAITGGKLIMESPFQDNKSITRYKLAKIGVQIENLSDNKLLVKPSPFFQAANIITGPYPGFPTDFQPQITTLLSLAQGTSIVTEKIFENRFSHIEGLNCLGADITRRSDKIIIRGVPFLKGNYVKAHNIQAGAALLLAGLAAKGKTIIDNIYHIDRGYERLDLRLSNLGIKINRKNNRESEIND